MSAIFDLALEKRFTDSPEAVLVDITPADLVLIRNNETGLILRLPFSVLAEAVSGALTGYLKSANNLSDVSNAGTARTNLGATTLGSNLFTVPNPGAVRFPRFNADNTLSSLSASDFRTAIGAGTSSTSGTVTSVGLSVPTGLSVSDSPITSSGTIAISYAAGYSIPSDTAQSAWSAKEPGITSGTTDQYWRGDKTWQTLDKSSVGLGSVNNTSDADKPVSTAQQTALNTKAPNTNPTFTGLYCSDGIVKADVITALPSLNTPVVLLPPCSGVLRIRDNTLGGAGLYVVDANGGVTTVSNQTSNITIALNGSLQVTATVTGGTSPRNLAWSFFGMF